MQLLEHSTHSYHIKHYNITLSSHSVVTTVDMCDCLSENQPSLHLVVFREVPFQNIQL